MIKQLKALGMLGGLLAILIVAPAFADFSTMSQCMQDAIGVRDNAIISAVETASTAKVNSLQTRMTALQAAWDIEDTGARNTALQAAWNASHASALSIRNTFTAERTAAWATFRTASKACGVSTLRATPMAPNGPISSGDFNL